MTHFGESTRNIAAARRSAAGCLWAPTLVLLVLAGHPVQAASTVIVGDHDLLPNQAGQVIELFVTGDDVVRGFNLRAQLGDGLGPEVEPAFLSADFTGGIWDAFDHTTLGGPVGPGSQFLQASVVFDKTDDTVTTDGLVAKLLLSTEGLTGGTFDLKLAGTEIGEDSDYIQVGGGDLEANFVSGRVRLIPEPSTLWLLGLIACLLLPAVRRFAPRID